MIRFILSLLVYLVGGFSTQAAFKVQEISLNNGLTVRFVEDHNLPIVSIAFLIEAGDVYDPVDKPFLTAAILDLLEEGTETIEAEDLKEILLSKGIQLSFTPTTAFFHTGRREKVFIQLRTSSAQLPEALTLLRSIFLNPRFSPGDLEEWVRRTHGFLLNAKKDPYFIAENNLRELIYGSSPWGISYLKEATPARLGSITPLDLRTEWRRLLTLQTLKIGVCGDISPEKLTPLLEELLKDIPSKSPLPELQSVAFPLQSNQKIITTHHPQAVVHMAHPGLSCTHKDYPAFALVTHILAGGMSSRLFQEIREKQGLVYSISATPHERSSGSLLFFNFESKHDQVPKALVAFKEQLILLKEKGLTLQELKKAKTSLLGIQARGYPSTLAVAHRLAVSSHLREAKTFYKDFKEAIDKITLADINHFIKNFIEPQRVQTVIVGQASTDQFEPGRTHDTTLSTPSSSPSAATFPSAESKELVAAAGN